MTATKRIIHYFCAGLILLPALATCTSRSPAQGDHGVRLVVMIAVDQLRWDYLPRYEKLFSGGFRTLLDQGIIFEEVRHDHAGTTTAPGHSVLVTGVHPARSGVVGNEWFDRNLATTVYSVGDSEAASLETVFPGRSPRNLMASSFGDWLKSAGPGGRVVAASRKDRAAVVMGGRQADAAYWIDDQTGRFVTSSFYRSGYPAWWREFHQIDRPGQMRGQAWEPLTTDPTLLASLGVQVIPGDPVFPHPLEATDLQFYAKFAGTPFADLYLEEFAEALVTGEQLGQDDEPDLLALSFSALDAVGHAWGPDSPEVLDTLLRLDASLDRLFRFLDQQVGLDRIAVALSSDHGVMTRPEILLQQGITASYRSSEERSCLESVKTRFEEEFGPGSWFFGATALNEKELQDHSIPAVAAREALARLYSQCPSVRKVWTLEELSRPEPPSSELERLYRNSFHPLRSSDVVLQGEEYHLTRGPGGTSHGTPYEYDRRVPLIFLIPGFQNQRIQTPVHTVDAAPTLAGILGLTTPSGLDGQDLSRLFR